MSDPLELWELPEGWVWAEFQQVAKVASNLVDPAAFPDASHIAPNHIESGTGKLLSYTTIAEDRVKSAKHQFFAGHILYSKIRPYLCKAVVVDFGGLCSADMYPIASAIDTAYLHRWMVSAAFTEMTSNHEGRTLLPKINQEALATLSVPVAPLAEQRRIMAAVERLLERVSSARERLERVPNTLKRFRQAVLAAACSGKLTADWRGVAEPEDDLPANWRVETLRSIADIRGGIQKQPKRTPASNAFPYLRVANVLRGRLDLSEIHKMELFGDELESYRLEPLDLLIVEGNGSISEIGRSALWTGDIVNCVHQNHIMRVRVNSAEPAYVNFYWNSPLGREAASGGAITSAGLHSLSVRKIAEMTVPLPPRNEQIEIVRRVSALFSLADSIEQRATSALRRVASLSQAVIAKAFRGELVPTEAELARREHRSYEPASELLSHLKASLDGKTKRSRGKRSSKRASSSEDGMLEFVEG
jgi:type I restriction enzyme S subunit